MNIDEKFINKLSSSAKISIERIVDLLNELGNPYYFPEYTIHGKKHIEKVLEHSAKIISAKSFKKLNSKSIDVLVLGICIHDLGMFITKAGFNSLLMDSIWSKRYEGFVKKLKNASGKELDRIFGAVVENDPKKSEVEERRLNMFETSNIFAVGEFIRDYHHELAYHIAINGFPKEDVSIKLVDDDYKEFIGYVAKAHRGDIRDIVKEVGFNAKQEYSPRGIPIVFLMTVIWVADEIDDKNYYRAPKLRQELQGVRNIYSQQQWADNSCVFEPTFNVNQSLVYVDTNPVNTTQYLRIEKYCKKIQNALDASWAILAEYYGKNYELTIHRVASTLYENKDKFDAEFLTEDASLRVNPDIVKLLVNPLYENNPAYGVRELLSNAIDACREREILDENYMGQAKIVCTLDAFSKIFTITDNGVGMTSDIIVKYFMNVGASFREDYDWKKDFVDGNGIGKVARFGRFGIGVLAAFLLGKEIEVTTRHWKDNSGYGYNFKAHLDGTIPDVSRIECDYGTTISIKIPTLVYQDKTIKTNILFSEYVKYEYAIPHYVFKYPLCQYIINDSNSSITIDEIYYYDSNKYFEIIHYDAFDLKIGSLLNIGHYPFFRVDSPSDSDKYFSLSDANAPMGKYSPSDVIASGSHSSRKINPWEITNFTHAKIEKVFYNGMAIRLDDRLSDITPFSDEQCMPLYININDLNFATSLNLQKSNMLDSSVLDSILKFHGFLTIMYHLTRDTDSLKGLHNLFPYADIVKHDESLITEKIEGLQIESNLGFIKMPVVSSGDFAFIYNIDYYLSRPKEIFMTWYIYEAIIEWLEVAPGYEQNYEIPHDIEERKRKFPKAFTEFSKYLDLSMENSGAK